MRRIANLPKSLCYAPGVRASIHRAVVPATIIISFLGAAVPRSSGAAARLTTGSRIHWLTTYSSGVWNVGWAVSLHSDTLTAADPSRSFTYILPLASLDSLELSRGTKSHALTGAGIGGGAGALVGALIGEVSSIQINFPGLPPSKRTSNAGKGAVIGAGIGAVLGAMLGSNWRSERWSPVNASGERFGIAFRPGTTTTLGVAIRY